MGVTCPTKDRAISAVSNTGKARVHEAAAGADLDDNEAAPTPFIDEADQPGSTICLPRKFFSGNACPFSYFFVNIFRLALAFFVVSPRAGASKYGSRWPGSVRIPGAAIRFNNAK